jgi:hypothetical protein
MKAKVEIKYTNDTEGYWATIEIKHKVLWNGFSCLMTEGHKSKGQLKRKVIQFCAALNLEIEWI